MLGKKYYTIKKKIYIYIFKFLYYYTFLKILDYQNTIIKTIIIYFPLTLLWPLPLQLSRALCRQIQSRKSRPLTIKLYTMIQCDIAHCSLISIHNITFDHYTLIFIIRHVSYIFVQISLYSLLLFM